MKLSIPDMSCGHCRATVEKTLAAQGVRGVIDLPGRTVEVEGAAPPALLAALAAEGYPAQVKG
ncbi:MAG: heavy-metal-associated domain-containing protein [Rhodobacteraceae bacterium]|nr:heavy-metal-associated domain-containing protein [Paracoccaceae bacterium]